MPAFYIHHLIRDDTLPSINDDDWEPCNSMELIGPFDNPIRASRVAEQLCDECHINESWSIVCLDTSDKYVVDVVSPNKYNAEE